MLMGEMVNWLKSAVCKTVASGLAGSIPASPTNLINNIMKILDLFSYTSFGPLLLLESEDRWSVYQTNSYKKDFKGYNHDKVIVKALADLLEFIKKNDKVPQIKDYPIQFNVHPVFAKRMKFDEDALWAHLKGQKIGLLFQVKPGEIRLLFMGTHQKLGWR